MPGVRQVSQDAEAPPHRGARPERAGLPREVGPAERLPDDGSELRGPAECVGEEDRAGHEAEEAEPEEKLTGRPGPNAQRLREIADHLIEEHGLEGALEQATEGTTTAQHEGDNYRLPLGRFPVASLPHGTRVVDSAGRPGSSPVR